MNSNIACIPSKKKRRQQSVHNVIPVDLLLKVLSYAVPIRNQRLLDKTIFHQVDKSVQLLMLNPLTPRIVIFNIIKSRPNLANLILDKVRCVDDEVLKFIFNSLNKLKLVSIAYCTQVTISALSFSPPQTHIRTRGCWRLATPSPSLTAYEVAELQLLALHENDPGTSIGIQSAGKFSKMAAHCYNALTEHQMSSGLRSIVNCFSFHIRMLGSYNSTNSLRRRFAHVKVHTKENSVQHFIWDLVKQDGGPFPGCWLVNSVRSMCIVNRASEG